MKKALSQLPLDDRAQKNFLRLYENFQAGPCKIADWDSVCSPDEKNLVPYASLKVPDNETVRASLSKVAVCKLNGGLGTSMGCQMPKSTIAVRGNQSFLDLIVDQLCGVEKDFGVKVPLILMNSFYTHEETAKVIEKYHDRLEIKTFQQSKFPRLLADSHQPLREEEFGLGAWYPPGHGDFYSCIFELGFLDQLLKEGREVLFVSNADNLGAVMDPNILTHILDNDIPFLIEMTPKTPADVKGGTIYQDRDQLKLLEIASVPDEHKDEFCSQRKFKVFNTNNIWIHLRHLRNKLQAGPLDLNVIVNRKTVCGKPVIQLETAIGSALECFHGSVGLVVSRDRFMPVKTTNDLLKVQSDLFVLEKGKLFRNPERKQKELPEVQLGSEFTQLKDFQKRISAAPGMLDLDSLEVTGDVRFGDNVKLKGRVQLTAVNEPLVVEDGSTLQDQVVER
ncbi:MAG: nucleotide glucose-1-phosphate uridylyl transferase [Nitrospinaceae bacterium]|nr:MAG: nucleotide glucose-1-phosphate uridylyl transferase [Nitrospinaceae bacterium]